MQDVEDLGNKYLVSINDTKNDAPRQFIIGELFYQKVKKYLSIRLNESFTDRFLIQYHNGKCQRQVIGRNKISEIPQAIASYLNLPNSKLYTGHCFRRTGATLLANSGASTTMLKQLGGWKSTGIAQGNSYVYLIELLTILIHKRITYIEIRFPIEYQNDIFIQLKFYLQVTYLQGMWKTP